MMFGEINHIIIFGGSRLAAELAKEISEDNDYALDIFTCDRQLNDVIYPNGTTLKQFFERYEIPFFSPEDISRDPNIQGLISENSLGLGLGEAWSFPKKLIDQFQGRLLDFMGIRLPQYRGGAHYTWQILQGNRIGCCNLQIINEFMVQGVFDSGEIVKSQEYFFPPSARIPEEYFEHAVVREIAFIREFLDEVRKGREFELTIVQENFSTHFPRLNTLRHGFINWTWNTEEIERFICAFDNPYAGASTLVDGQRVYLKNCHVEYCDGPFHPFQSGLVYRKKKNALFVATRGGTMVVKRALDEKGSDILENIAVGQRFHTPKHYLEEAMTFQALYGPEGIKEG